MSDQVNNTSENKPTKKEQMENYVNKQNMMDTYYFDFFYKENTDEVIITKVFPIYNTITIPPFVSYVSVETLTERLNDNPKLEKLSIQGDTYIMTFRADILGKYFKEYEVSENNSHYCSIDGVLFTKDRSSLLSYPNKKEDTKYIIPDGVSIIQNHAFTFLTLNSKETTHLRELYIPESVVLIREGGICIRGDKTKIHVSEANTSYASDEYGNLYSKDKKVLYHWTCQDDAMTPVYDSVQVYSPSINLMSLHLKFAAISKSCKTFAYLNKVFSGAYVETLVIPSELEPYFSFLYNSKCRERKHIKGG